MELSFVQKLEVDPRGDGVPEIAQPESLGAKLSASGVLSGVGGLSASASRLLQWLP